MTTAIFLFWTAVAREHRIAEQAIQAKHVAKLEHRRAQLHRSHLFANLFTADPHHQPGPWTDVVTRKPAQLIQPEGTLAVKFSEPDTKSVEKAITNALPPEEQL